jgi:hypothetical protein
MRRRPSRRGRVLVGPAPAHSTNGRVPSRSTRPVPWRECAEDSASAEGSHHVDQYRPRRSVGQRVTVHHPHRSGAWSAGPIRPKRRPGWARQLAAGQAVLAWIRQARGDRPAAMAATTEAGEVGPSPEAVDPGNRMNRAVTAPGHCCPSLPAACGPSTDQQACVRQPVRSRCQPRPQTWVLGYWATTASQGVPGVHVRSRR